MEIHTLALHSITIESMYDKKSTTKIWDNNLAETDDKRRT